MELKYIIVFFSVFTFWSAAFAEDQLPMVASSVSEGACIHPPIDPNFNGDWWASRKDPVHITAGSRYAFLNYAEMLLGRPVQSSEELEEMCAKVLFTGFKAKTLGYNRTIDQNCEFDKDETDKITGILCVVEKASPGINTALFETYKDFPLMSDNKEFVLFARCVNGIRDYKVITVANEISQTVFDKIRKKITRLGFNPHLFQRFPCTDQISSNEVQ